MILNLDIHKEKVRCLIVNLIFIIYWLLIFEGTLRKWAFPQYNRYIFFTRDLFALLVYWLAFSNRLFPKKKPIFSLGITLAVLFLLFTLLQVITTNVGIGTLIYGWRMYFFYLPLAFIIGENFRGKDLKRLIRQTLLVAIPIAVLVYYQHTSPPNAFINKSVETDVVYTIRSMTTGSKGIVRPTGTFTFFRAQQLFTGSVIAFVFTAWILPKKERPLSNRILLPATGAAVVNLALSGTRSPYILAILICLAAVFAGFLVRRRRMSFRTQMFPMILILIAIVCFAVFFTAVSEVTLKQHRGAELAKGSSVLMRAIRMCYRFTGFISSVPVLGTGIGLWTGGGSTLTLGYRAIPGFDDEWSRIILETGPIFGFIYIIFRILLVGWLFMGAIRATRLSGSPFPILLFAFIGVIVLIWNITGFGSENGYAWLFTGFCIAANQLGQRTSEGERGVWS